MEILTVKEAADVLKLHYQTVLKLVKDETIKATAIGNTYRIDMEDLKKFMRRNEE